MKNEQLKLGNLATNTITPLLKRMEQQGLVGRQRSDTDERQVRVHLTGFDTLISYLSSARE